MSQTKTRQLVRSTLACTATLSLTFGLLGTGVTRALAATNPIEETQVAGEIPAADTQDTTDQTDGIVPVDDGTNQNADADGDGGADETAIVVEDNGTDQVKLLPGATQTKSEDEQADQQKGDDKKDDKDADEGDDASKSKPKFVDTTIDPGSAMGPIFWLQLPKKGDVHIDKVELSVGGKQARTVCYTLDDAERDGEGNYGFRMPLMVIEMAEPVKAVAYYNDGETEESTITAEKIITRDAHPGSKHNNTDALESLMNLGFYTHPWLAKANGWKIGEDYALISQHYKHMNDVKQAAADLEPYDTGGVTEGKEHIKKMTCCCRLDALTAVEAWLTPADGESFSDCTATLDGHEATCKVQKDGRLYVRVNGISAVDYDKMVQIQGTCGNGHFSAQVSVLSYTANAMKRTGCELVAGNALASMYWFYHYVSGTVN